MPDNIDHTIILKLRNWIASSTKQQTKEVGMDTNLISEGVLDSLEMVNFLIYIEEIRGQEIAEALIQPQYFVSLKTIYDTFFRR